MARDIDGPLQKLLKALHKLFEWWKESRPKRRDVAAGGCSASRTRQVCLSPETLEKKRVDSWLGLHNYFVRVAHQSLTTPDAFRERLDELEQILLDTLYPVECLSCFRLMIEGDRERWLLVGVEDDARRLLRSALDSNQPDAALPARRLVEDLIAKGHFGFSYS